MTANKRNKMIGWMTFVRTMALNRSAIFTFIIIFFSISFVHIYSFIHI